MCVYSTTFPICRNIWHITRWCLMERRLVVDKSIFGWHCCGMTSCLQHQSKYFSLCLLTFYLHVSCMTSLVICFSVLLFAIGLSVNSTFRIVFEFGCPSYGMKLSWMGTCAVGKVVTTFCLKLAIRSSSRYVSILSNSRKTS